MHRRLRVALGPIVHGLVTVGLCTLVAAAQQSASPAADATAPLHAPAANAKDKPASTTAADSASDVSSDANNTGVANPDAVTSNESGDAPANGPAANAEPSQNPAIHDSPRFNPDQPQRPLAPDHDSDTPAPLDPPEKAPSAETIVATPVAGPAAASTPDSEPPQSAPPTPSPEATVPPQTAPATVDNATAASIPATSDTAAPQQTAPVTPQANPSAQTPQQNAPATSDNTASPTVTTPPAAQPIAPSAPAPTAAGNAIEPSQTTAPPAVSTAPADAAVPQQTVPAEQSAAPGATPAASDNSPAPGTPAAPDATAPAAAPQDQTPAAPPTPAAPDSQAVNPSLPGLQVNEPEPPPASRLDIFGGYTYLHPTGNVGIWNFPSNNTRGYIASGTYYFTHQFGVQAEFSHSEYPLGTTGTSPAPPFVQLGGVTDSFYTVEAGPVYRFFPGEHIVPFVHLTGGAAKVAGPKFQPPTWGYGFSYGGGVDLLLPHTHEHVAFRLAQVDFGYMHADQGALQQYDLAGGTQAVSAVRLSAGLVYRFGEMNPAQSKSLACDATPAEVYAGERVTLAATLRNYRDKTKHPFFFNWVLSGGKQQGFGPVIFVDTTGLAGGTYHATAHIANKEKGKQFAQCGTDFVVKESPAPTLKCSADPSTVTPGQVSIITAYASTIAQRQLTYTYTTSEGQINGKDNTAELHTDGLAPGVATVTCKVLDDLGRTAVATTEVTIAPPSLPPAPKAQPLCTVYFNRDMRRPTRVDNEGRACLDDVALTLEHQPDARLVLVGEHSDSEVDGQLTAAERAMNTRAYLANEKGIDPSRVDVRTSTTPGRQVQTYLLAPGAVFDQPTEGRIDESKIKIHGQQYAHQRMRAPQKGPVGHGVSHPPKN